MTRPKAQQNRLRQLSIKRIDLVDRGAAVDARVTLFKRREPVAKDAAKPTLGEVLAALPEERRTVVEAALAEGARAVQSQAQTAAPTPPAAPAAPPQNQSPEAPKPPAPPPPQQPKEEPQMPDMTPEQKLAAEEEKNKKLAEEAALKKRNDEAEDIRKQLASEKTEREALSKKLAEMQDENLQRECVAKAAEFPRGTVGLSRTEAVSILKSLRKKEPIAEDVAKKLEQHFAAVDELLSKSAVFKEIGSGAEGEDAGAAQKIQAIAKALKEKDPTLSEAASITKAYRLNPELYTQATEEARR